MLLDSARPALRGVWRAVRVLAPEELIASKLFVSRRERFDGADIVHIIYGTRGELDWNRVLSLSRQALGNCVLGDRAFQYVYPAHVGYIPGAVWDDLLARFALRQWNTPIRTHNFAAA